VIASPAPSFFSIPVLVSADPEVPGIAPPHSPDQEAISALVRAGKGGHWAEVLAARDIKYVLLARELDWKSFDYLRSEAGFEQVADYESILLYRVSPKTHSSRSLLLLSSPQSQCLTLIRAGCINWRTCLSGHKSADADVSQVRSGRRFHDEVGPEREVTPGA